MGIYIFINTTKEIILWLKIEKSVRDLPRVGIENIEIKRQHLVRDYQNKIRVKNEII